MGNFKEAYFKLLSVIDVVVEHCQIKCPGQLGLDHENEIRVAIDKWKDDDEEYESVVSDTLEGILESREKEHAAMTSLRTGTTPAVFARGEVVFGDLGIHSEAIINAESAREELVSSYPELDGCEF